MSEPTNASAESQAAVQELEDADGFQSLITGDKTLWAGTSDETKSQVADAFRSIAEIALERTQLISGDVIESVRDMITAIDDALSAQVNEVLHHEKFQTLESSWRGLEYLVNNSETGTNLKVRVMNASKAEVGKVLKRYDGTRWDQSPLFKELYSREYDTFGGAPYGCIVGDYFFDSSPPDVAFLQGMAKISAAGHSPFLSGVSPEMFLMESWDELDQKKDVASLFEAKQYAAWNGLRDSEDSRYLGLALPRFMGRQPYGAKTNPVDEFAFEEDTGKGDIDKYNWINAAYALATNINRSFSTYGWCTQFRGVQSGGGVYDLPVHTFATDDGGTEATCPTEISLTGRRENELSSAGFISLVHKKNSNEAAFISGQSVQKPIKYDGEGGVDATASAALSARLSHLFPVSRFAHYLKKMVHDMIGLGGVTPDGVEKDLNTWINQYVEPRPQDCTQDELAKRPLSEAQVQVEEDPESPGSFRAVFSLKPHYQLEDMTIALRLTSKLPRDR